METGLMRDAAPPNSREAIGGQQQNIQNVITELDAVKGVMETDILKCQERGKTLDQLQQKTGGSFFPSPTCMLRYQVITDSIDSLSLEGQTLRSLATKTRRKIWLQNAKVRLFIRCY
jgi:hypothetical protein